MRFTVLSLLICFFSGPVMAQSQPSKDHGVELKHAEQLIATFQQRLKKELMAGLSNGATEAIEVCRSRAPLIASELSNDGVIVGRASLRQRNHTTQSPEWVQSQLEYYQQAEHHNAPPRLVEIEGNKYGYVKPIYIKTPCLRCHGENITPTIEEKLAQYYPNDQAVNYKKGQFRGVFWVESNH